MSVASLIAVFYRKIFPACLCRWLSPTFRKEITSIKGYRWRGGNVSSLWGYNPFPGPGRLHSLTMSPGENDSSTLNLQIRPCKLGTTTVPESSEKETEHSPVPGVSQKPMTPHGRCYHNYRQTAFKRAFALLCSAGTKFFYKLKVCGNAALSKSMPFSQQHSF